MTDLPVFTLETLEASPAFEVDAFTNDDAVRLGMLGVEVIRERGLDLAVDVVLGSDLVFRAKLGSTGPGNDEWLAGKAAVARHYGVPPLLVRRRLEASGRTIAEDGLDDSHRPHARRSRPDPRVRCRGRHDHDVRRAGRGRPRGRDRDGVAVPRVLTRVRPWNRRCYSGR